MAAYAGGSCLCLWLWIFCGPISNAMQFNDPHAMYINKHTPYCLIYSTMVFSQSASRARMSRFLIIHVWLKSKPDPQKVNVNLPEQVTPICYDEPHSLFVLGDEQANMLCLTRATGGSSDWEWFVWVCEGALGYVLYVCTVHCEASQLVPVSVATAY